MRSFVLSLRALPLLARWTVVGTLAAGSIGAVAGLVIGLRVHAATAWFAVFELGIPAAIAGGLVGLVGGTTLWLGRRGAAVWLGRRVGAMRRREPPSP